MEVARRTSARAVNAVMTATYWNVGRRIVEFEQGGKERAEYGEQLLSKLSEDLTGKFGRGFGVDNLERFRAFYLAWSIIDRISATVSRKSSENESKTCNENLSTVSRDSLNHLSIDSSEISQTLSANSDLRVIASRFPLPWSAYVRLLSVKDENARTFYELALPDEKILAVEIKQTRKLLETRKRD